MAQSQTAHLPVATKDVSVVVQAVMAMTLGLFIIGMVGFSHIDQPVDHDHDARAWEPRDGLERNIYTAAANVLTAIGFALLLSGIFALRQRDVTWHEGL